MWEALRFSEDFWLMEFLCYHACLQDDSLTVRVSEIRC